MEKINYSEEARRILRMNPVNYAKVNERSFYAAGLCVGERLNVNHLMLMNYFVARKEFLEANHFNGMMNLYSAAEKAYKPFIYISYKTCIERLPMLHTKTAKGIRRLFIPMCKAQMLEFYDYRSGGSFPYYRLMAPLNSLLLSKDKNAFLQVPVVLGCEELIELFRGMEDTVYPSDTGVPWVDKNVQGGGQNCPDGVDSTVQTNIYNTYINTTTTVEAVNITTQIIIDSLKTLFPENSKFTDDFIPNILKLNLPKNEINQYLEYMYEFCKKNSNNPGNLKSYYYSCATEPGNVSKWRNELEMNKGNAEKQRLLDSLQYVCPKCGKKAPKGYACTNPQCDYDPRDYEEVS